MTDGRRLHFAFDPPPVVALAPGRPPAKGAGPSPGSQPKVPTAGTGELAFEQVS
jgi:hypothetical protein